MRNRSLVWLCRSAGLWFVVLCFTLSLVSGCKGLAQKIANFREGLAEKADRPGGETSQATGAPAESAAKPGQQAVPTLRDIHVLVIGVGKFTDGSIPSLPYAEADAKFVFEFFQTSETILAKRENIHLLTSRPNNDGLLATRTGISQAVEDYLVRRATNAADLVIIYFAGHGDEDARGNYYWIPSDAKRRNLVSTAYSQSELDRMMALIPARNHLVISDARHRGALSGRGNVEIKGLSGDNKMLIVSCQGLERPVVWKKKGHGVLTWALVEGLNGYADTASGDGDDRVTLGELKKYLQQRVPKYARKAGGRQTPLVKIPELWRNVYLTKEAE